MANNVITVSSAIDPLSFISFGFFESYCFKKKWKKPLTLSAIFLVLSAIAYLCRNKVPGAMTWCKISLVFVLAIPIMNVVALFSGLLNQISKYKLARDNVNYHLIISDGGVSVVQGTSHVHFNWNDLFRVFFRKKSIYMYVSPEKAYLIPMRCIGSDAIDIILENVDPGILSKK